MFERLEAETLHLRLEQCLVVSPLRESRKVADRKNKMLHSTAGPPVKCTCQTQICIVKKKFVCVFGCLFACIHTDTYIHTYIYV